MWTDCIASENYQIMDEYPFSIKKKSNNRIIKETVLNGFYVCTLDGIQYYKHKIIASQFLDNPHSFQYIRHLNKDNLDNHLENLEWKMFKR